jgi:hypothetical protein
MDAVYIANAGLRLLKLLSGRVNAASLTLYRFLDWVSIVQSASDSRTIGLDVPSYSWVSNVQIHMTGSAYNRAATLSNYVNVDNLRLMGNPAASGGYGLFAGGTNSSKAASRLTALGHPGHGVLLPSFASSAFRLLSSVISDCGGTGFLCASTVLQDQMQEVKGCIITGNGLGIDASAARVLAANNRLRHNTSGDFNGMGNYPTDLDNYTDAIAYADQAAADAAEYVDAANGDYRIKYGSSLWGKGIGAGDEPAPAGGGSVIVVED